MLLQQYIKSMDLNKIRNINYLNSRFKQLCYRKKLLSLNINTPVRFKTRQQKFQREIQQIVHKQSVESDNQNSIMSQQDKVLAQNLKNNKLYKKFKKVIDVQNLQRLPQNTLAISKVINRVINLSEKKVLKKKYEIQTLEKSLESQFIELHNLNKRLRENDNSIKKQIDNLKHYISTNEQQLHLVTSQLSKIKIQIINFLRIIIKYNYPYTNGLLYFMKQLQKLNYTIKLSDMPDFVDKGSFQQFIKIYHNHKKLQNNQNSVKNSDGFLPKLVNRKKSTFAKIASNQNLNQIYYQSKQFVKQWVEKRRCKSLIIPNTKSMNVEQIRQRQLEHQTKIQIDKQMCILKKKCSRQKYLKISLFLYGTQKQKSSNSSSLSHQTL